MTASSVLNIARVSTAGLLIDHGEREELVHWQRVQDISVGTMKGFSGESLFVMAIELACGRILMCREDSGIWHELNLYVAGQLPAVVPFDAWGPALVAAPGAPLVIYTFGPVGSA
ncbi:hypothetical protein [Sphingomonas profundi]|uniref:hypothetical protein n=1 Tax=Alterirhizorhabdus profundi TaxID=2681549 RepID=UPI0012E95C0C|nr:hypothetical protein [Sphingomonas profundi]